MIKRILSPIVPKKYKPYLLIKFKKLQFFYSSISRNLRKLLLPISVRQKLSKEEVLVNLCSGEVILDEYINIDLDTRADLKLDLERSLIPFNENSVDRVVMMSAINYFTYDRATIIINDIYRILKPGGIIRVGVQDLELISKKYLDKDYKFFFQTNKNFTQRFHGETLGDKINYFFYRGGSGIRSKHHKYMWDFNSLKFLFHKSGFERIENKKFLDSNIPNIDKIDNRPEMFFYLEARKPNELLYFKKALSLLKSGKNNQSWQMVLKALDVNLYNTEIVKHALKIMIEEECIESGKKLVLDYSSKERVKNIREFKRKLDKFLEIENQKDIIKNRNRLEDLFNNG